MTETAEGRHLFTRTLPIGTETVQRPFKFYVSPFKGDRLKLQALIRHHGGEISKSAGNLDSKIVNLGDKQSRPPHGAPPVYSTDFVQACIDAGKLLDMDDFLLKPILASLKQKRSKQSTPKRRFDSTAEATANTKANAEADAKADATANTTYSSSSDYSIAPKRRRLDGRRQGAMGKNMENENGVADGAAYCNTNNDNGMDANHMPSVCNVDNAAPSGKMKVARKDETDKNDTNDTNANNGDGNKAAPRTKKAVVRKEKKSIAPCREAEAPLMAWTSNEDETILNLCREAERKVSKKVVHSWADKLKVWQKFYKNSLLPRGRSPNECMSRFASIRRRKDRPKKNATPLAAGVDKDQSGNNVAKNHRESAPVASPVVVVSNDSQSDGSKDRFQACGNKKMTSPSINSLREKLIRLVKFVAKQSNVSERRAFLALRAESGDKKKAMERLLND